MFYCSEISGQLTLDGADTTKSTYQSAGFGNSFTFKFKDLNGQVHRFNCGEYHLVTNFAISKISKCYFCCH